MHTGADRDAQVQARVRELLQPGETFRAAVWVSRAEGQSSVRVTRAEMSPFRLRRPAPERRGVHGAPRSLAVGLDEHIRTVNDPRVLALSDHRVLLLARRPGSWRALFRPEGGTLPPLRVRWECPRTDLSSAAEEAGRLRLTFADRSAVTLLTPAGRARAFVAG